MNMADVLTTHTFGIELGNFLVETCQGVSDIRSEQEVIEVKQVTLAGELVMRQQPGAAQRGEVTICRGLDKSEAFTDWIRKTLEMSNLAAARQNVTIVVMDAQKNRVRRIHLKNAWASSWERPSLQDGSAGPAIEQVTLSYEDASSSS